ncbi:hypothetical protein [Pseudobacteroides cellulosolvens]|uniref:Uncharacterized protein n=1 Tax=Pseudobacteroides cellulosolvens ATCC 35603 = DSM 2933 TaxID=398512 RepID=A0A0L6JJF2_9FIRM|nr:hypothetical protein [Pseudobacteroides cellulosolvens]KNY25813.1 hypothetical protein Bccel_1073 [Pseudobacteroides cellulosolvens ATCC 35603 = DSM 2933]
MSFIKSRVKDIHGFTYIELVTGMGILLLGFSFFMVMFRYFNINKIIAKENTTMAAIAQNTAESYEACSDVAKVINNISKDYEEYSINVDVLPQTGSSLKKITITVGLKSPSQYVNPYKMVYYSLNRSNYQ